MFKKLEELQDECLALENAAGISEAMERARRGHFIPMIECTSDEYFADEFDYFRDGVRDAYFSVTDMQMRRDLIALQREIDRRTARSYESAVTDAKREAADARRQLLAQPWDLAGIIAIVAVAVGYWKFGLPGAIGGAVGGFFFGYGVIARARSDAQSNLEFAENRVTEAEEDNRVQKCYPECFSLNEEIAGERDEKVEIESAYGNVVRMPEKRA